MERSSVLVKWDASVVGETPPIGEWFDPATGAVIKVTSHAPGKFKRFLVRVLKGHLWRIGLSDPSKLPGFIESRHF